MIEWPLKVKIGKWFEQEFFIESPQRDAHHYPLSRKLISKLQWDTNWSLHEQEIAKTGAYVLDIPGTHTMQGTTENSSAGFVKHSGTCSNL